MNKKLLTTTIALLLGMGILQNAHAESNYTYNGHIYLLVDATSWTEAQEKAKNLGGNLVTINDQAENDWITLTFKDAKSLWIGYTDQETEGIFKWISGENSVYSNFSNGEPNDYHGNDNSQNYGEDYGHVILGDGKWNDMPNYLSNWEYTPTKGLVEVLELYSGAIQPKETVQISGQIKLGTQAGKGVSLSGDGLAESCLTDANGKFNCKITKGWTGFLTPESKGVSFSPSKISVTDAQTNLEVKTPLVGTTTDSFPLNGVMTSDWVKLKTDKATWQVETSTGASDDKTAYEGRFSFGSAKIGTNQTAAIETTINVTQAGQLSFARRVSSNPEHGVLNFEISGKQKNGTWKKLVTDKWSGEVPWELKNYNLSVGQFKLRWTYAKDGAEAKGEDKAWIDAVSYPSSVKVAAKTCEGITAGTVKLMTIKNPTCDQLQAYRVWLSVIRPSRLLHATTFSREIEGIATSNDTAMTYIEWGARIYGYIGNPLVGAYNKETANKIVGDLSSQLHGDAFSIPCKAIEDKATEELCGTAVSQAVGLGFTLAMEGKDALVNAFPYLVEKGLIASFNLYNAGELYEPTKQLNNFNVADYFLDDYYKAGGKLETLRTLYKAKSTTMIDLVNALASNKSYVQPDGSLLNSPLNPFVSYDYYTTHEVISEIENAQKLNSELRKLKLN